MDFLGPIGLTIALAWALEKGTGLAWSRTRRGTFGKFNYWLVALGAVLPDLIDKPLGIWAPEIVNNSFRSVGHSLPFAALSIVVVWILTRRRGPAPAAGFALAMGAHLVFDRMWETPRAFLWPFLGWSFPEGTVPLGFWLNAHFVHPTTRPHDVLGIAVLAIIAVMAAVRGAKRLRQPGQAVR